MALPANGQYAYTYDGLKRLTTRSLSLNGNGFLTKGYTYVPGAGTNSTTMLVGGLTNKKGNTTLNSYTYTYDNVGNITAIGGTTPATYTYDSHGQMLTETVNGVTYTYTYDTYGNIRSVSDGVNTYTYTYGDSNWKDLLTAYCGQSITYDQIGNPTHWYNGNNFTWVNGRRLATITASSGGTVASYTYDVDGLRQTKTVGGVEHRYVWQGNKLVSEYWDGKELEFFYDESGMPYAISYKSSSSATPVFYYYVTNLQGDVVKILTASGSVVANYSYNAWGKLLSSSGTMASVNPIRYRGYYFDTETGFYYLVSRYYDPQICRFVNADRFASTGQSLIGCNMFAYCFNYPTRSIDNLGLVPDDVLFKNAELYASGANILMCGYAYNRKNDITYKLNNALEKNSTYLEEQNYISAFVTFIKKVRPGGNWDFKAQDDWNLSRDEKYYYNGKELRFDDIGNIHYGYVGRVVAPKKMLLIAAGIVQVLSFTSNWDYSDSYYDDPHDQEAILYGIELWEERMVK